MGTSRTRAFTCKFRPFRDDLSKEILVLFYQVPNSHPVGPVSVFVDRWWDEREHWIPDTVGVVPGTLRPYFGKLPPATLGPVVGSDDQFINGLLYSEYVSGGYTNPNGCADVVPTSKPFKLRQSHSFKFGRNVRPYLTQSQRVTAVVTPPSLVLVRQAQSVPVSIPIPPVALSVMQAEKVLGKLSPLAAMAQSQQVQASMPVDAPIAQAHLIKIIA